MKKLRTSFELLSGILWLASIAALWVDDRPNSLWVLLLLMIPMVTVIILMLSQLHKAIEHPEFGGGDTAKVVRDVYGSKKDFRFHRVAIVCCNLIGGSYMAYAGHGLEAIGAGFVVAEIGRWLLSWTDTTKPGRRFGKALGLPLTPDRDLPLERTAA